MSASFSQAFPPRPVFTEKNLPDLTGKVYFITGPTSGIGLQLSALLYSKDATVFLAARSRSKLDTAVEKIKSLHPSSKGLLYPLDLDLGSYDSIKAGASEFLSKSRRLDVLFHNAGVLAPPKGSENSHGVELQMGVHCLGPYLLTDLLEESLKYTARLPDVGIGETRVVWVGSSGAMLTPKGGVDVEELRNGKFHDHPPTTRYCISKAGEYFLSGKFNRILKDHGVLSVYLDPGNIKTDLQRTFSTEVSWIGSFILNMFLHRAIQGAYTELFAGLSPDLNLETLKDMDTWVIPFGRLGKVRADLVSACRTGVDEQSGNVVEFFAWCDEQLKGYL
ncbi:short-chain dehydrogenase [Ilyonectria destructans]|nr:short-chain dehydrogenase [Ilyonectria destructans]